MNLLAVTARKRILAATAWTALVLGSILVITAYAQPQKSKDQESAHARIIPLKLGLSMPLAVQSSGVEWKGKTLHLVTLSSIQFELDKTGRLKSDIQAEVMTFDDVVYDISSAVFDATGQLLGTARTQCKVERIWLGYVVTGPRTISLDFGVSLDYSRAAAFMISVSKRRVLTPDEWQK